MKKIAISQRVEKVSSYKETRDCLDQKWQDLATHINCYLFPMPTKSKSIKKQLDALQPNAIILSGGNTLAKHNQGDVAPEKDTTETDMLSWAIDKGVPVLGVCRGMQLINQYFKGGEEKAMGHINVEHNIVQIGSVFDERVNSFHAYVIKKDTLSPKAEILAYTPVDDVIEAFKIKDKKVWGIMWHPERVLPFSDLDIKFIRNILEI